ncbi:serine O-acetyltransferase [Acetobacter sp. AN02]|nr:serine O-acetyltransferase [Acetobacter sp. AN02]MDG6093516.1 serine O-acetyltransferase [Acetobacter sp. AN02]
MMQNEARLYGDPFLAGLVRSCILDQPDIATGLARLLSSKFDSSLMPGRSVEDLIQEFYRTHPDTLEKTAADLVSVRERDPAASDLITPFLFFKGFHALQAHRVAHWLWHDNRTVAARFIQGRASELFAVDIHPAARLGQRIMFDHGTGIVIGETTIIEDDVALLQNVTLGGTGKENGDRHPKVRKGALIGTGAKILGNIEIGEGARVGAGAVVLKSVDTYTTVVGNPARPVGKRHENLPSLTMDQALPPEDYVI